MNIQMLLAKKVSLECSVDEIRALIFAINVKETILDVDSPTAFNMLVFSVFSKVHRYLDNRLNSLEMQAKNSGKICFCLPDLLILHCLLVEDYGIDCLLLARGKIDKIAKNHSHLVTLLQPIAKSNKVDDYESKK